MELTVLAIVIYVGEFEFFLFGGDGGAVVACVLVCNTCAFVPY